MRPREAEEKAAGRPRGCVRRTAALSARCLARRQRPRAPRGPGRDRHAGPARAGRLGPLDVCFRSLPLPPRRGGGVRAGEGEPEAPPPRGRRPSPSHTRTHPRAGSHTLARLGVGPPRQHVHGRLLLQFLSDPSSPAAEDAAQRRGLPARLRRRRRRRERERCGRRRRGLRPCCGRRPAAAAHPRHGALPAAAGQPAQSHAPARRRLRRLAGQPPGARRGPRPQPAQPDAAAAAGRAGAAGQGPPETVP